MSFIDQLLKEAESELSKEANDENGAPDNASNQEQGGGDILATAQAFMQKVEQLKAALGDSAAAASGEQEQVQDPNAQTQNPEAQQQVGAAPTGNGEVVISRPDGTQIKLASLQKLAALRGANLFKEV